MNNYYEIKIKDKGVKKVIKQIILFVCLFGFFVALLLFIFAFIISYYLFVPFAVLVVFGLIFGSLAHLISKDYIYTLADDKLIIKKVSGGVVKEVDCIYLDSIHTVQMQLIPKTTKYTPYNRGITLMTDNKNYAITPDNYLLARIAKDKVIL